MTEHGSHTAPWTMVDADGVVPVLVNESEVSTGSVIDALTGNGHREVAEMVKWATTTSGSGTGMGRQGGLFQRDRYVTPERIFDQMRVAYDAAESDDVISGVLDTSEALAFNRMSFMADDEDEEDIWNQVLFDLDLDSRLKEMWRELYICSQFYALTWWGKKSFKVRGRSATGVARKKTYDNLTVPLGVTLLDPTKVIPIGNLMFNQEQLAYVADRTEVDMLDAAVVNDPQADPVSRQIIMAKYAPSDMERRNLARLGVNPDWLYILNPKNVWRHTLTRAQYERFAKLRMKSIFEILDLKQQLRQMDRAHLIGGPLRVDQRIPTPDGWKPIGAAQVGDKVYSVDGQLTDIIGVFPQGVLPMYRVTFTDGAEVYCDPSHPWTVRTPKGEWRTIRLEQIMAEGLICKNGTGASGKPQIRFRHEIPIIAPVERPAVDLPLDPYLIGYLLGDGHLGVGQTPRISADPNEERPWAECLPDGVQVIASKNNVHDFCLSRVPTGRRPRGTGDRSNPVVTGLAELGLLGAHARDKHIPEVCFSGSVQQRWALLQGLADSDGTARPGGTVIGTASAKLADGIVELVQSLGGIAYKRTYGTLADPFFHIDCQFHGQEAPFRLARKVAAWRPRRKKLRRCIANVEQVEDAEAICIKTAREDGLFCTEGYVTTHNTNFIVLIRKGSDHLPAKPEEVTQLRGQVTTVARTPILVGDHRLSVDIITPKQDYSLNADKYSVVDARLTTRMWGMFLIHGGQGTPRSDDSVKLAKIISRGLEARRQGLRRALERHVIAPAVYANPSLSSIPTLRFHPTRIELDFDPATSAFIQDARDRGDLSRDSYLNELDFDQEQEAIKRQREAHDFDSTFVPTNVPFSAPGPGHMVPVGPGGKPNEEPAGTATNGPATPAVAPHSHAPDGTPVPVPNTSRPAGVSPRAASRAGGRAGGNKNGGGAAPGSGQGQAPRSNTTSNKPNPRGGQ